ncbi:MAG: hypothetical protein JXQ90_11035 [Cyclobacteriaceae bacterium]
MKRLLTFSLVIACFSSWSQQYMDTHDPEEIKSILNKENELHPFAGADVKAGQIYQERAIITGAYGGVMINKNLFLGLGGYGIATDSEFEGVMPDNSRKMLNIEGGYAGIMLGGIVFAREVVHITVPVLFGAGALYVTDNNFFEGYDSDSDFIIESSSYLVVEPTAQIEVNITKSFRIGAGVSYRYLEGLELKNLNNGNLNDYSISLSVRFGRF